MKRIKKHKQSIKLSLIFLVVSILVFGERMHLNKFISKIFKTPVVHAESTDCECAPDCTQDCYDCYVPSECHNTDCTSPDCSSPDCSGPDCAS